MTKKRECAVCRAPVKEMVKSRAVDSFLDRLLHRFSEEAYNHRKQLIEDRKKGMFLFLTVYLFR